MQWHINFSWLLSSRANLSFQIRPLVTSGAMFINVVNVRALLDAIKGKSGFSLPILSRISTLISAMAPSWPALGFNSIMGRISNSAHAESA